MQTKQGADTNDIYARILQLERRLTMEWYNKDRLLNDLYRLRQTIHILSRKHKIIDEESTNYYKDIDKLIDRLI